MLGWSGAGYIILDPETNVGAWKISGGANGSETDLNNEAAVSLSTTSIMQELGSLIKDTVFAVFDEVSSIPAFNVLDFLVNVNNDLRDLSEFCQNAEYIAAALLLATLSAMGLFVGALFPLVFGIIFGYIFSLILRQVLLAQIEVCRN